MNLTREQLLAQYIPARNRWPFLQDINDEHGLPPFLLFAVGSRETRLEEKYTLGATGDGGHGHGVFQLDDRWHKIPAGFDHDIRAQAVRAAQMLADGYRRFGDWVSSLNYYNSGKPDTARTTGGDYGPDVWERRAVIEDSERKAPTMKFVSRSQWGAKPSRSSIPPIRGAVGRMFIHHTVTPVTGDELRDVRTVQSVAFGRGFSDISYSFLVHPTGTVYEGRGWGKVGAHTQGFNSTSYAISFIGNYENMDLSDMQVQAARDIIAEGKARGFLTQDVKVFGHRDVKATACPGRKAHARLDDIRRVVAAAPKPVENRPAPAVPAAKQEFPTLPGWPGNPSAKYGGYNIHEHSVTKDGNVGAAQEALNRTNLEPKLEVDWLYGPKTEAAVRGFQGARGLKQDGILGPWTHAELKIVAG